MDNSSQENKGSREEEVRQEEIKSALQRNGKNGTNPRLADPDYTKSKELWQQFIQGKLTARELAERLEPDNPQEIADIFEGEIL